MSPDDQVPPADAPRPTLPGPAGRGAASPRSTALRRWGPLGAILAVVAIIAALTLTGGGDDEAAETASGGSAGEAGTSAALDPEVVAKLPVTYAAAEAAGTVDDQTWPDTCDPETGRLAFPSLFAPPCVPEFTGDNGGALGSGVTAETIKIVNYVPSPNGDLSALLQGAADPPEVQQETQAKYVEMLSAMYETYGREVELVNFQATGADEVAARADAVAVAEEYEPFASLGGPGLTQAYAEELAARGILCISCGVSAPDSKYQELTPYMWGTSATPEQYLTNLGDYITNRLMGDPAEFAGDDLKETERVFGVVHFEQDPPVFEAVNEEVRERGAERGYETELTETYTLDIPKLPERADTIVSKMKAAGVTTIIFLGDPIMPIYLTQSATAQDYEPEWIVTGTVLTDTAVFGRRYDQTQWSHAFGLSALPTPVPQEMRDAWRLHEWWFGEPPAAVKTNALLYPPVALLMLGIHLAGPELTPETFQAAMFSAPPTGGGPTAPHVSFGSHAGFENPDFLGTDDMTEIWWDPDTVSVSEQGVEEKGVYRYSDGGKRYMSGEMPEEPTKAFVEEGSVYLYEEIPEEDRYPEYDPPAGAPSQR